MIIKVSESREKGQFEVADRLVCIRSADRKWRT